MSLSYSNYTPPFNTSTAGLKSQPGLKFLHVTSPLTCSLLRIYLQCLATILVDLHLRTKADLYSFMQGSFVKIQDLIGYVSKYMLNAT